MTIGAVHDTRELLNELVSRMKQRWVATALELDLTPPQMGVLANLDDSLPMSRLASEIGCDASNITWMTDRLEARGLVERRPDPNDRRVKRITLTEAGRKMRRDIERRLHAGFPGLERLSVAEREALGRLLEKMLAD